MQCFAPRFFFSITPSVTFSIWLFACHGAGARRTGYLLQYSKKSCARLMPTKPVGILVRYKPEYAYYKRPRAGHLEPWQYQISGTKYGTLRRYPISGTISRYTDIAYDVGYPGPDIGSIPRYQVTIPRYQATRYRAS